MPAMDLSVLCIPAECDNIKKPYNGEICTKKMQFLAETAFSWCKIGGFWEESSLGVLGVLGVIGL